MSVNQDKTVKAYKNLTHVEQAFRSFKSVDLKVHPIYHRTTERVKTQIFLCLLAYYVEWHMRQHIAPILFDEDDWSSAEIKKESVVTSAQKSDKAKANVKKTY